MSTSERNARLSGEREATHEPGRVAAAPLVTVRFSPDLEQSRETCVQAAADGLGGRRDRHEPAVALRHDPERGVLIMALGGRFDAEATDRLRGRVGELRALATSELLVDCSQLQGHSPALERALVRLRMQMLIGGARVQFLDAPDTLTAQLGSTRSDAYTVTDDPPRTS